MSTHIRVLSYNIHKGFSSSNLNFILKKMKATVQEVKADIVLLQEVLGHHDAHGAKMSDWPNSAQFEYLADSLWPHFAYGKNAIYTSGHHGNAILSKFPISYWQNQDISQNRLERRGLLHAQVEIPRCENPLHVVCAHLGLFESDRKAQVELLCRRIEGMVPADAPLIVGGDFNDWREILSRQLKSKLGLDEAFAVSHGGHARTFPSWLPVLKLDRLYFRGLNCEEATLVSGGNWKSLSDHLPIVSEFRR